MVTDYGLETPADYITCMGYEPFSQLLGVETFVSAAAE